MSQDPARRGMDRLILEVLWGPLAQRKAVLAPGQVVRVGRSEPSGFVVPHDETLASEHFELSWDGTTCLLKDLDSRRGTQLGGTYVQSKAVSHGGWIRAGNTDFSVHLEAFTPPRPPEVPEPESLHLDRQRALAHLQQEPGPLWALLDAAKDERIRVLLRESVEEYRSLYEGPQGEVLEQVAPYLVALPKGSGLLERLVLEGWGKSWGVFLSAEVRLDELRRHFRHFLRVQDPKGRELYFRFYDPRVLEPFLATCTIEDTHRFFGPIHDFYLEGASPKEMVHLPPPSGNSAGHREVPLL